MYEEYSCKFALRKTENEKSNGRLNAGSNTFGCRIGDIQITAQKHEHIRAPV